MFPSSAAPQGDFNLGNANGRVTIDASGVDAAMQQAQRAWRDGIAGIGRSVQAYGQQIESAGMSLTAQITAPLAVLGTTGVKAAANFEEQLVSLGARGQLTADQLDEVTAVAQQLGADTIFSSQDVLMALEQLITAGLDLETSLAVLPDTLNLAANSTAGLGQTADQVSDVMAAFSLSGEDAARIADTLTQASLQGSADVNELAQSLQRAGGVAAAYGLTLEQTTAMSAALSSANLKGAEAGTAMLSMIRNMNRDVPAVRDAFDELGVSLFSATGEARDISVVMTEIEDAVDKLSDADRTRILQSIFGAEGFPAAAALMNASGSINELVAELDTLPDSASIAEKNMDTFNATVNSLFGSIETLQQKAFMPLIENGGFLKELTKDLIEVVNAASEWVDENPVLTQQIIRIGAIVAAVGPTLLVVGKAITIVGGAIAALASPVGLAVAGLAALALAWKENYFNIRQYADRAIQIVRDFVDGVKLMLSGDFIGGSFGGVAEDSALVTRILGTREVIQERARAFRESVIGSLERIRDAGGPLVDELREFFGNVFANVDLGQIFEIGTTLLSLTSPLGVVMQVARRVFQVDFVAVIEDALGALTRFFDEINNGGDFFDGLRAAFGESGVIDFIEEGFNGLVNFVKDTVIPGVQAFIDLLKGIWADVSPFLSQLFNWFMTDGLAAIERFIAEVVVPGIRFFRDLIAGIWKIVSPHLANLYNWFVKDALPGVMGFIEGPFTEAINRLITFLSGIWDAVREGLGAFKDGVIAVLEEIGGVVQGVIDFFVRLQELMNTNFAENFRDNIGIGGENNPLLDAANRANPPGAAGGGARAMGGPVSAGESYLVGERGPEIFSPNQSGYVLDAATSQRMMAGSGDTINVTVYANDEAGGRRAARALEDELERVRRRRL